MVLTKYFCGKCKRELLAGQKPCPFCGSNNREIKVIIEERILVRETVRSRQRRRGFPKFIKESVQGWFPSGNKKEYPEGIKKTREIDRTQPDRGDSYKEKITDIKTGKIIRNIEESLSRHQKQ